ncbi:MAG: cytochrome c biogenesis protein ResB [Nitrospirae bacterium]|nr:cytochrome c biogenesis protein ResB [Nitrospirota bacterium]
MPYRLFSSLKTSVYILILMSLLFLIGTIFPQGEKLESYIKAGGKYAPLVRALDFLDVFMSPLFIFTTVFLIVNLAVCLYDRMKMFLKIKRKPMDFEGLKGHPKVMVFKTPLNPPLRGELKGGVEDRLRKIGFRLKAEAQDADHPAVKIYEKGLQYWWLSWFYHVGIILAIIGFFLTALFAFEKDVVLYPDKPGKISLYSKETRWNKFLLERGKKLPGERKDDEYTLTLKEFNTEYYQGLKVDYPKDKLQRLAIGAGLQKIEPSKKGFSYMPKMWITKLDVKTPEGDVLDGELKINKPFRTGALTLYQMGYEQKVKLAVSKKTTPPQVPLVKGGNTPLIPLDRGELSPPLEKGGERGFFEENIEAEAHVPFQVKDVTGQFVFDSLKLGTLYRKDGTTEKIAPVTTLYYIPEGKPSEKESLGELKLGERLEAKGVGFEFRDYTEGSALSYRKDPGVWLVGFACLFVFLGLFVRSLGAWYRIQYAVEGDTAYVLISTRGILADKDRIINKLLE